MELESKKYKNRIIVNIIILIFSVILGVGAERQCKEYYDQTNKIIETIQATPEEEYEKRVQEGKFGSKNEAYETKEKALKTMETIRNFYERLFKYSELYAVTVLSLAVSGTAIGIMMYFIFTGWILHKIWPDMIKWLSILMRILALIILIPILFYIIVIIGVLGQLPFIIYILYKYIKTKKTEDKDDIIAEKQ